MSRPRPRGGRPRALPRLVAVLAALAAISIVGSVRAEDPPVAAALGFGGDGGAVDASPVREEYPIATDQTDDAADDDGEEADDGEELRRRLDELERLLYLGGVEHRDAEGALVGMFELASEAPSMEEVIEVTGRGVGGAERLAADARRDLDAARDAIRSAVRLAYDDFNGRAAADELETHTYLTLDRIPGDTSRVNIAFDFERAEHAGVGYVGRAIARAIGLPGSDRKPSDPTDVPADVARVVADAKRLITDAVRSEMNAHKAAVEAAGGDASPSVATPARWAPIADALFILAALAEAGVVPPDAWPLDALADTSPSQWSRDALALAAEMGSREASIAIADRVLFGRGAHPETEKGADCDGAAARLAKIADDVAGDAESAGDFALPREPGRLRDRERDAGWVSAQELEDGDDQILMEEDMAARGVPEAQRHVGYRRLLGRGMERDEAAALREFEAAANQGDELAQFNLGYMHMRGMSVPRNFTEAKRRFEAAAAKDLPAAHNGLGVLAFNGHGGEKNLTAAREHFERGAARGDPDSQFNLASMHAQGLDVPKNETRALELYAGANEAGHWRAPLAIAVAHRAGAGTEPHCAVAAHYFRVFIDERSGWTSGQEDAMRVLDGGPPMDADEADAEESTNAAPDPWGALVRYALLAEQGCESAAANAGWLLAKRAGYDRDDHVARAIAMLERSVRMGNHESHVDLGNARWDRLRAEGGFTGKSGVHPSGFECERCGEFGDAGWLASRGWLDAEDAQDKEGLGLRRVRLDRVVVPPAGLSPEEEIAFHYAEASAAGFAEGTVALAWAHAHGVGVPRNLSMASHMLSHAMHNAVDDEEAVPAFFAWVGVGALRVVDRFVPGVGSRWYAAPGSTPGDARGERGRDSGRSRGGGGGGGGDDAPGIGAGAGEKPVPPRVARRDDPWHPLSRRVVENCVLLALAAAWGIVAYARRALNDPGFDQNIVEQMPVGALAGVGAAIAVAAGVSVAVFGG